MLLSEKRIRKLINEAISASQYRGKGIDALSGKEKIKKGSFKIEGKPIKKNRAVYNKLNKAWVATSPFLPVGSTIIASKTNTFTIKGNIENIKASIGWIINNKIIPISYKLIEEKNDTIKIEHNITGSIDPKKVAEGIIALKKVLGQN